MCNTFERSYICLLMFKCSEILSFHIARVVLFIIVTKYGLRSFEMPIGSDAHRIKEVASLPTKNFVLCRQLAMNRYHFTYEWLHRAIILVQIENEAINSKTTAEIPHWLGPNFQDMPSLPCPPYPLVIHKKCAEFSLPPKKSPVLKWEKKSWCHTSRDHERNMPPTYSYVLLRYCVSWLIPGALFPIRNVPPPNLYKATRL